MEIKRIVNKNAQLDGDWKTIKNPKYFQTYFYLLIGCLMANFVPFSKKQPHPTNVNHRITNFWPKGEREPNKKVGYPNQAEHLVGFEMGTVRSIHKFLIH